MMDSLRNFLSGPGGIVVILLLGLPFVFLGTGSLGTGFSGSFGSINGEDLKLFKKLLGMKFEDLNTISISRESRTRILKKIINYYSLHLQMFKTPKSINVFAEVFK